MATLKGHTKRVNIVCAKGTAGAEHTEEGAIAEDFASFHEDLDRNRYEQARAPDETEADA